MKALRFLALLLLTPCLAHAGIEWEREQLEFHPAAGDTEVKAEFNFTNTGKTAVTIESIKPGCDSTTAALDKKTYQPGEKGRITATFIIGERRGGSWPRSSAWTRTTPRRSNNSSPPGARRSSARNTNTRPGATTSRTAARPMIWESERVPDLRKIEAFKELTGLNGEACAH